MFETGFARDHKQESVPYKTKGDLAAIATNLVRRRRTLLEIERSDPEAAAAVRRNLGFFNVLKNDAFEELQREKDFKRNKKIVLRDWQWKLTETTLKRPPPRRSLILVVDPIGNRGKHSGHSGWRR